MEKIKDDALPPAGEVINVSEQNGSRLYRKSCP